MISSWEDYKSALDFLMYLQYQLQLHLLILRLVQNCSLPKLYDLHGKLCSCWQFLIRLDFL